MKQQEFINYVTQKANELEWHVDIDCNDDTMFFEFSKFTPAGQDFNFSVSTPKDGYETLTNEIWAYAEAFDPDFEATFWIGDDGHGKNGAPHHIKDIVEDMEYALEMIYELHNAL